MEQQVRLYTILASKHPSEYLKVRLVPHDSMWDIGVTVAHEFDTLLVRKTSKHLKKRGSVIFSR
jgi:hypothetical protein